MEDAGQNFLENKKKKFDIYILNHLYLLYMEVVSMAVESVRSQSKQKVIPGMLEVSFDILF